MKPRFFRLALAAALALAAVSLPSALAGPERGAGSRHFPTLKLGPRSRGQEAVNALDVGLPAVARAYGLEANQLRTLLLTDPTLALDSSARLHYTEPVLAPAPAPIGGGVVAAATPFPLADTFLLHSRAGAKRIIYLDFNGHVFSGTVWNAQYGVPNNFNAPAFDMDGVPSTFNDIERERIQEIWQRVSEDYAPFDVDVTTELTSEAQITRSSSDEYYGTRVLISPMSSYVGNYGGVAYLGVFDDIGDYYKPALVFPEKLGPNSAKYIAEAASHEAGHNLGLNHDATATVGYYSGHGTGDTGWAPIMGVGYYKNLSQWSKGEYAGASNGEDDLNVMSLYGLPPRADDHGNTAGTATFMAAGASISADGIIQSNSDVDVFAFSTGAGNINLSVVPAALGPNLDIYAELRNGSGGLLATNNPADLLSAGFNLNVAAGTYFLHIRGTGKGDPLATGYTSYGSLGEFTITGTVIDPSGAVLPVAVATATPSSGNAPLLAHFDGSGSFDQDGFIVAYAWNFGDNTTGSGAIIDHTYGSIGNYTAILTVTDNDGRTDTASVAIQALAPNVLPIAVATATPSSGLAPLAVTLSGASSSDPDGSISSYNWVFGDDTTGSGISVSHTYSNPGNYTATLTVTDNRGGTSAANVGIVVTQNTATVIRIQSITLAVQAGSGNNKTVRSTVKVTNIANPAVGIAGVTVSGSWSGKVTGNASAVTDVNGNAVITSKSIKGSGSVTFTVNNLVKSGYTYSPASNVSGKSATISFAPAP